MAVNNHAIGLLFTILYCTVLYYTFFIILFLPSLKSLLARNVHIKLAVASHTLCLLCILIVSGPHEVIDIHCPG